MLDDIPDWFNKGDRSTLSRIFDEIERMIADTLPEEMVREHELADGRRIREFGPFTYGYSMKMGPDGKPEIKEFGNIRPPRRPQPFQPHKPNPPSFEEMEMPIEKDPIVDVFTKNNQVKVIVEMPGIQESDIAVECSERSLIIRVNKDERRKIELPVKVDPKSQSYTCKNGVLEITLNQITFEKQNDTESNIKWL